MGFGIAIALALDATLVRLLLIPAAMRLLGERNWYLPGWLSWLPNVQVEGPRPAPLRPARTRRGIAVWYGGDRHGQTMANGRPFDQRAMTGASVHFPLGARVRVTDLETRRSAKMVSARSVRVSPMPTSNPVVNGIESRPASSSTRSLVDGALSGDP